ncbi:coiled-coil domain-containing protein 130 homolog [Leptopilina heterotoma]|uniref:coiled-coil domain-containing protein 130 homolog n=1 Tax=Leptopilina heterotoma TaxID=63436 RepID=UPI001CA89226|nr:coiled-coil domain-containing protein 130 homolog [Leptopilina heterotoma]
MGERKGQNLYYPPDYDPTVGGLNKFLGTHALRERARKLHEGILIIRFEMPFNIWCEGCKNHIGMGVRYNAEKTKVGMYYSTPLYQFRMKCHLCDNHFEIKTDPANLDYIIVSGARRQENRWDPTENEQVVPETKETSRRLYDDPMYKLEHGIQDKGVSKSRESALSSVIALNDSIWKDDYSSNSALRAKFRAEKKELEKKKSLDKSLLNKMGIDIHLVEEHDDDVKLARLLMQKMKVENKKGLQLRRLYRSSLAKRRILIQKKMDAERKKIKILPSLPSASTSSGSSNRSLSLVNYGSTSSDSDS